MHVSACYNKMYHNLANYEKKTINLTLNLLFIVHVEIFNFRKKLAVSNFKNNIF